MAGLVSFGAVLGVLLAFGSTALGADSVVPVYSCEGFEPPMNLASLPPAMGGGVIARKVAKNRALPFKATLVDADGNRVTNLATAPRLEVQLDAETNGPEADVVEYALLSGGGSTSDAFELSGNTWQFNLRAKDFGAPQRYTATMTSGDTNEYLIDPTCRGVFLVE